MSLNSADAGSDIPRKTIILDQLIWIFPGNHNMNQMEFLAGDISAECEKRGLSNEVSIRTNGKDALLISERWDPKLKFVFNLSQKKEYPQSIPEQI